MVEGRWLPGHRRMAEYAAVGERCRNVVRTRGSVEIFDVASVAIRRCPGEDIVHVAREAGCRDVGAGQRERRLVVIEERSTPIRSRMAQCAGRGLAGYYVIRFRRLVVIRFVTRVAVGRHCRVVVVGMAESAGYGNVGAGQGE